MISSELKSTDHLSKTDKQSIMISEIWSGWVGPLCIINRDKRARCEVSMALACGKQRQATSAV